MQGLTRGIVGLERRLLTPIARGKRGIATKFALALLRSSRKSKEDMLKIPGPDFESPYDDDNMASSKLPRHYTTPKYHLGFRSDAT